MTATPITMTDVTGTVSLKSVVMVFIRLTLVKPVMMEISTTTTVVTTTVNSKFVEMALFRAMRLVTVDLRITILCQELVELIANSPAVETAFSIPERVVMKV